MKGLARLLFKKRIPDSEPLADFRPKVLIFDFDGTIGDTFEAGFHILNALAEEFGFRPLTRETLESARDMRTRELMKFLGIPTRKMSRIARSGSEKLSQRIDEIQPLAGMPEVLRRLASEGFSLGIVTSNTEANVLRFLKNHNLEFFDFVRSSSKLMGKAHEIRSVLKSRRVPKKNVLFIGDETRDIEASQKAGIRIAVIAGGYNSNASLKAMKPDFFLESPAELLPLLGVQP